MSKNLIDLIYEHLIKLEMAVVGEDDGNFDLYSVGEEGSRKNIEQLESLRRLLYSIEIYKQRDAGLFTVIFLGHFSSAKSSTLNWILKLWDDPDKKRPTGNTSTDTDVTILSHPRSSIKNRVSTNHAGISVVVVPIDNPLLENAIYLDTPGSGDFAKDEENLKEYLFWSDLVVFCTNSNETLGHNDIEVLLAKEEYLSSLPLIFAFTKVDNLFTDIIRSDTADRGCHGFKQEKYEKVVEDTLEKLDRRIQGHTYTNKDFYPLLTYEDLQHGVNELTDAIKAYQANRDPKLIQTVTADRIAAFRNRAKICKHYFQEFGLTQLKTLKNHFSQLESNRQRFNKLATFHNSPFNAELELGRNRIKEAHRSLVSEFAPYGRKTPPKFSVFDEDKKEWFQSKLRTEIFIIKGMVIKDVSQLLSQQKNNYANCQVSDFIHTIEKILFEVCRKETSYNLKTDAGRISLFKERIIAHLSSIKKKERQYLPVVIKEINKSIENIFFEQIDSFKQNLNDFTEAAATMGDLDVFRISVARNELKKMIETVKEADIETPDISSRLIDSESIEKNSDIIFSKLKLMIEEKIAQLKRVDPPSEKSTLVSNLFVLENDNLPVGYDSSSLSSDFLDVQKAVKEEKTEGTLSLMRQEKINRLAKLGGIVLPPIAFLVLFLTGKQTFLTQLESSNGIIDSIIAALIVNGAGAVSVILLISCVGLFYYSSNIVKNLIDSNREEKQQTFLSRVEDEVIEGLISNLNSHQLKSVYEHVENQCKDEIGRVNKSITILDAIREDANSHLLDCTRNLEGISRQLFQDISNDSWSSFLSNVADQAKDKRVEELFGYMNNLVAKAEQRVQGVKQLEISSTIPQ